MHPWMLEQLGREHRRSLLAQACRMPAGRKPTWRERRASRRPAETPKS